MQNLAGRPNATAVAAQELQQAGVPITILPEPWGEPQSWAGGELPGFTFRRAWRYWVVEGRMPLAAARLIHAHPNGAEVRVNGNCTAPAPEDYQVEWCDPEGRRIWRDPDGKQAREWASWIARHPDCDRGDNVFAIDPSLVPGAQGFITEYHVDTEAGLRLIAYTIRGLAT